MVLYTQKSQPEKIGGSKNCEPGIFGDFSIYNYPVLVLDQDIFKRFTIQVAAFYEA